MTPYLAGQRDLLTYADPVHRDDHGTKFDQLINGHFEPEPVWQEAHPFTPLYGLNAADRTARNPRRTTRSQQRRCTR